MMFKAGCLIPTQRPLHQQHRRSASIVPVAGASSRHRRPMIRAASCMGLGLLTLLLPLAGGCASDRVEPPAATTRPVTMIDPEQARPAYWYAQPGEHHASNASYDRLWDAAERAARDRLFTVDSVDYRRGVLMTSSNVSGQFFEPWRGDVADGNSIVQSSLGTVRRTIRFEFESAGTDQFQVTPKVLVERQSRNDRRTTVAVGYRSVFVPDVAPVQRNAYSDETPESSVPYWYAIGRDHALEEAIAKDIARRLQ